MLDHFSKNDKGEKTKLFDDIIGLFYFTIVIELLPAPDRDLKIKRRTGIQLTKLVPKFEMYLPEVKKNG